MALNLFRVLGAQRREWPKSGARSDLKERAGQHARHGRRNSWCQARSGSSGMVGVGESSTGVGRGACGAGGISEAPPTQPHRLALFLRLCVVPAGIFSDRHFQGDLEIPVHDPLRNLYIATSLPFPCSPPAPLFKLPRTLTRKTPDPSAVLPREPEMGSDSFKSGHPPRDDPAADLPQSTPPTCPCQPAG